MRQQSPAGVALATPSRAALLGAGLVTLLAGCALDPHLDPHLDPEVLPLEVVVNSDTQPDHPCLLNYDQVRAGDHAVTVIGVSGYARVRFVDARHRVVFRTDNAGQRIETDADGEVTIIGGESEGSGPSARLEAGTVTVQCRPKDGKPGEATLKVLPARKGHTPSTAP